MIGQFLAIDLTIERVAIGVGVIPAGQRYRPKRRWQSIEDERKQIIHATEIHDLQTATWPTQIAGDRQQQHHRALQQIAMQPLGDAEAGKDHRRPGARKRAGHLADHVRMHARDRTSPLRRVGGQMGSQQLENRRDLDQPAAGLNRPASFQGRLYSTQPQVRLRCR